MLYEEQKLCDYWSLDVEVLLYRKDIQKKLCYNENAYNITMSATIRYDSLNT